MERDFMIIAQCVERSFVKRIESCVAREDDIVEWDQGSMFVQTDHAADFLKAYYGDGFTDDLKIMRLGKSDGTRDTSTQAGDNETPARVTGTSATRIV